MTDSYIYSLPYVVVFLVLFLLCLNEIKKKPDTLQKRTLRFCCCTIYVFFIGLRGFLHTDWISYYPLFKELPTLWSFTIIDLEDFYMEPGFILYSIIIKSFCPSYYGWIFISTLIDVYLINACLKKNTGYYALGFLFFYSFFTLNEINLLRNTKAIMLFLLSVRYIGNNFLKFSFLNIIGAFFHISSLLYIFIYPFLRLKIKRNILIAIFICGVLIYTLQVSWALPLLEYVSENLQIGRSGILIHYMKPNFDQLSIGFLERVFTFILFLFYRDKIYGKSPFLVVMYNCYIAYFISTFFLAEYSSLAERISTLFIISYVFIYPEIFKFCKNKRVFIMLMFSYMLLKEIQGNKGLLNKYSNVLFGVESYEKRFNEAMKAMPALQDIYLK